MKEYYGPDWREILRAGDAASLEEKVAAGREVRRLFPHVRATTAGSGEASAPKASTLLRRATMLLVGPESYEEHYAAVVRTCVLGAQVFPDTFTPTAVRVIKAKVNLMMRAYETIATGGDRIPPGRDHPDVGKILVEAFLDRFARETDVELFSPTTRSLYEAYEELLECYEMASAKDLLAANRTAAAEAHEEEPPEFRRQTAFQSRCPPTPTAAPHPRGPGGPTGFNSN